MSEYDFNWDDLELETQRPGVWFEDFGEPPWTLAPYEFLKEVRFSQGMAAFNVDKDECVILRSSNGKYDFMLNGKYIASSLDDIRNCEYSPVFGGTVLVAKKGGSLLIATADKQFWLLGNDCFEVGENKSYPSYFFVTFDANNLYGWIDNKLDVKAKYGSELLIYIDVVPKTMRGIWLVGEGNGLGRIYYNGTRTKQQIKGIAEMEHHSDKTVSLWIESADGKSGKILLG